MTLQNAKARVDWRRVVGGGVLAVGLMSGFGVSTAFGQPADPTDQPAPRSCTGDDCKKDAEAAAAEAAGCEPDDKKCAEAAGGRQSTMTADQALTIIYNEYSLGDGGGQLSSLIDDVMKMRAQGYKPSNANKVAIEDALAHRPNQTPLIEALKTTLQYQRKIAEQQAMAAQQQQQSGGNVPVIPGG